MKTAPEIVRGCESNRCAVGLSSKLQIDGGSLLNRSIATASSTPDYAADFSFFKLGSEFDSAVNLESGEVEHFIAGNKFRGNEEEFLLPTIKFRKLWAVGVSRQQGVSERRYSLKNSGRTASWVHFWHQYPVFEFRMMRSNCPRPLNEKSD